MERVWARRRDAQRGAVTDPTAQSATVGGTPAAGEIFTVTIDTIPVAYVAECWGYARHLATGLAAAINATTTPHPYSGLPLNDLLAVSAVGAVVTVRTADAGPPFDLACSIQLASTAPIPPARRSPPRWSSPCPAL